jgi:fructose-specific phosphotransferase system IIC component
MILSFLSFWCVTPELVGEVRLTKLRQLLQTKKGKLAITIAQGIGTAIATFLLRATGVTQRFFNYKMIEEHWIRFDATLIGAFIAIFVIAVLVVFVVIPITEWFSKRISQRHWLLLLGAWLFVISCTLQFVATFPNPP